MPGFVRVARVRQRLGTRDEQRALAGFVVAAEPQRHREPLRGAVEREGVGGTFRSQLCTAGGRLALARTRPVMRESLGRRTARFERAAEHAVQGRSLDARQPANERLADAIMIRLDDVVAREDHARRPQLGDRGGGFVRPELRGGDRNLPRQRRTVGDDDVQYPPRRLRQVARARPQRVVEAAGRRAPVGGKPAELGDEHRMSLRLARDRSRVDRLVNDGGRERDGVLDLETTECDLLDVREAVDERGLPRPTRRHDEQHRRSRRREQVREERAGVGIGPLRVVDQQRERLLACNRVEHVAQRAGGDAT